MDGKRVLPDVLWLSIPSQETTSQDRPWTDWHCADDQSVTEADSLHGRGHPGPSHKLHIDDLPLSPGSPRLGETWDRATVEYVEDSSGLLKRARVSLSWLGAGAHRDCYKVIDFSTGRRWQGICLKCTPEDHRCGKLHTEAEFNLHLQREGTALDDIIPNVYGMGPVNVKGEGRRGGVLLWLAVEQGVVTLANWNYTWMQRPADHDSTATMFGHISELVQLLIDAAACI